MDQRQTDHDEDGALLQKRPGQVHDRDSNCNDPVRSIFQLDHRRATTRGCCNDASYRRSEPRSFYVMLPALGRVTEMILWGMSGWAIPRKTSTLSIHSVAVGPNGLSSGFGWLTTPQRTPAAAYLTLFIFRLILFPASASLSGRYHSCITAGSEWSNERARICELSLT